MELDFKIVKSAKVWAGFGAHRKRDLEQNQTIERVVYSDTYSINWFSYCSKPNFNSYLDSLGLTVESNSQSGVDQLHAAMAANGSGDKRGWQAEEVASSGCGKYSGSRNNTNFWFLRYRVIREIVLCWD